MSQARRGKKGRSGEKSVFGQEPGVGWGAVGAPGSVTGNFSAYIYPVTEASARPMAGFICECVCVFIFFAIKKNKVTSY